MSSGDLLVLLLLAALTYALHRRRTATGPGASATDRARRLRTWPVRLAELLGVRTVAGQQAHRYAAGAAGERAVAAALRPLERQGWTLLHDRALPAGRANLDLLAISPRGTVAVVDAKKWSARLPVTVAGGRLVHGRHDVTARLDGLRHEAAVVTQHLGVRARAVVVLDGPALHDHLGRAAAFVVLDGITLTTRANAVQVLAHLDNQNPARRSPQAARQLAARAADLFPPHTARRPR